MSFRTGSPCVSNPSLFRELLQSASPRGHPRRICSEYHHGSCVCAQKHIPPVPNLGLLFATAHTNDQALPESHHLCLSAVNGTPTPRSLPKGLVARASASWTSTYCSTIRPCFPFTIAQQGCNLLPALRYPKHQLSKKATPKHFLGLSRGAEKAPWSKVMTKITPDGQNAIPILV